MGNISASFSLPSPKTACYRALFWTSRRLGLRDFEILDHNRQVIQTTIMCAGQGHDPSSYTSSTFTQQVGLPAKHNGNFMDKCRRHHHRIGCVHWADLIVDDTMGYKYFSTLHVARNPVAHWMRPNLFSTRMFGQNDPPCPEVIATRNNLAWLTSLKVPSALNNYKYPMRRPPFLSYSMPIFWPLTILPQKLFQPLMNSGFSPLRFLYKIA